MIMFTRHAANFTTSSIWYYQWFAAITVIAGLLVKAVWFGKMNKKTKQTGGKKNSKAKLDRRAELLLAQLGEEIKGGSLGLGSAVPHKSMRCCLSFYAEAECEKLQSKARVETAEHKLVLKYIGYWSRKSLLPLNPSSLFTAFHLRSSDKPEKLCK